MVVFTDDDCYLDPDYFDRLRDAAGSREFDYFGGNILLFRDGDGEEGGYLNRSDTASIAAGTIPAPGEIQGANMGFRRAMLGVIGYFNPLLGAGTPFRFEDIDYVARASLAGFRGAHLPSVQVRHDHRRVRGSPELQAIYRSNCRASGAYFLNVALLDRRRGLAAWRRHWRGLLDGAERNRERLKLEAAGAGAYLLYLARHGSLPRLKY
jgi:GT2 family glycosyltransferase